MIKTIKNDFKGVIYIIISTFCYGILPILAVFAYRAHVNVNTLLSFRFLTAFILLLIYILGSKIKIKFSFKYLAYFFVIGGLCFSLVSGLYLTSIKYISVSMAVLLMYTYPIFVAIYSIFVKKEKMPINAILAILIAILGLIFIVGASFHQVNIFGIILALGSSAAYTLYVLVGDKVVKDINPIVLTCFSSLFTFFSICTFSLITKSLNFEFFANAWIFILGIAFFSTVLAALFFFKGLTSLGTSKASVLSMLEPFFAIVFSALILNEKMSLIQILGGILLILGIAGFLIFKEQKRELKEAITNLKIS